MDSESDCEIGVGSGLKKKLVIDSSDEEVEASTSRRTLFKESPRRKRILNVPDSSSEGEENEGENIQKDQCSKRKRRNEILLQLQKERKDKKLMMKRHKKDYVGNEIIVISDSDPENDPPELYVEVTRVFTSQYNSKCSLPECNSNFICYQTKIVGVHLYDKNDGGYKPKPENNKPYWICAKHSKFYECSDEEDEELDSDFINDDEEEQSRIDSFEEDQGSSSDGVYDEESDTKEGDTDTDAELKKVIAQLGKQTPNDKRNKRKFLEENGKYQLQIHSANNPGLYLSEEKRFRRNMRTAKFDKGLKEDIGLGANDPEYYETKDVFINNSRIKIFPSSRTFAQFEQFCELKDCDTMFKVGRTEIVAAMLRRKKKIRLNSRGERFWICYSHVEDYQDSDSE